MRRVLSFIFPDQASNLAPPVDAIFFSLLTLCSFVALLVFLAALFFCLRFRRGSKADRRPAKMGPIGFELVWTIIPFLLFVGLFFWGANVYFGMSKPPEAATEIHVVGKQWMWKIQHPDGRREINELHLLVGRPVKLIMTSEDVIHDFFVPAFAPNRTSFPAVIPANGLPPPSRANIICFALNTVAPIIPR
jgi:cytochrome c oxidase subunit II